MKVWVVIDLSEINAVDAVLAVFATPEKAKEYVDHTTGTAAQEFELDYFDLGYDDTP